MHTAGTGRKKILSSLEKKRHVPMANQNNLHAKHKPSQHPHPLTFLMVHPLGIVEKTYNRLEPIR